MAELPSFFLASALAVYLHLRSRHCAKQPAPPPGIIITSIHLYPVKSMRGHSVARCELDAAGLKNDRRWMVVCGMPAPGGVALFLTQRSTPALATITPHVLGAAALAAVQGLRAGASAAEALAAAAQGSLAPLSASDAAAALLLCLDPAAAQPPAGTAPWVLVPLLRARAAPQPALRSVQVWKSTVTECVDQGAEAAGWLSAVVGQPARLVYQDPEHAASQRATVSSYVALPTALNPAAHEAAGAHRGDWWGRLQAAAAAALLAPLWRLASSNQSPGTSFADGFPLLLASENSLADLNARMAQPMGMERFRPNVVVAYSAAAAPWLEDTWAALSVGSGGGGSGASFAGVKRCSRCSITTTDQVTGQRGAHAATGGSTDEPLDREPLATMATFRASAEGSGRGGVGGVFFGMNLMLVGPPQGSLWGTVAVGDAVRVTRTSSTIGPL